jgi:hypothetical protein
VRAKASEFEKEEQLTAEVLKHQGSQATVSLPLEGEIKEVVERGDPLVSSQI